MKPAKPRPKAPQSDVPRLAPADAAQRQLVTIEKPIYGGAFMARIDGKATFVPLTLPGEQARIRIVENKRGYATAEAEQIVAIAPERVAPKCSHFGICGGCHYQHADYVTQLNFKQTILRETLQRGGVQPPEEIAVLPTPVLSQSWAYRNRIRLAFDARGNFGYRGLRSHSVVSIRECPIAAPLLIEAARAFAEAARQSSPPLHITELSLFCNADETALLASVFVASLPKIRFDELAEAVHERVPALQGAELVAQGNAGERSGTLAKWGATSIPYRAADFDYRVDHGAFFQVNRWLVDALVDCVTAGQSGSLAWDLFAGVGLFARRLASTFARVIAVESASSAIAALQENLDGTSATAVHAATLDFLRLPRQSGRPDLIVVDPPRTGLGAEITGSLAQIAAPSLVYVSCDPATLARDLNALVAAGYQIESLALADLFPQTFHLETVVHLRRS
ncbi:MAG: 23S rRNA (uracil(1939)-C(5))-methyltransferase RlmD [Terracidiphilus sp.]|jgi:23S rRNA (uracil1939-C5)-methyltransferase